MIDFTTVIGVAVQASSSSSDNDFSAFGLVFPLIGIAYFVLMFLKYRNVDKREHYESSTDAAIDNLRSQDAKIRSIHGVSNSQIRGNNEFAVRGATTTGLPQVIRKMF